MDDFHSICHHLLHPDDINVQGWEKIHGLLTLIIELLTKDIADYEVMVTGSSVEFGKFYQPDDVGDIDIMISSKLPEHMVSTVNRLEDISQNPGFVRIKTASGDDYVSVSTLKANAPKRLWDWLALVKSFWPKDDESFLKLHCKIFGPAHELSVKTNYPPLLSQLQDSNERTDLQNAFLQNFIRLYMSNKQISDGEDIVERITSMCTNVAPPQSIDDVFIHMANVLNSLNEVETRAQDKNISIKSDVTTDVLEKSSSSNETPREGSSANTPDNFACTNEDQPLTYNETPREGSSANTPGSFACTSDDQPPTYNETPQEGTSANTPDNFACANDDQLTANLRSANPPDKLSESQKFSKYDDDITRIFFEHMLKNRSESFPSQDSILGVQDEELAIHLEKNEENLVRKTGIDFVLAIRILNWHSLLQHWFERDRCWPPTELLESIKSTAKLYAVVKHPAQMDCEEDINSIFRLSFSHFEKILCQAMNQTQNHCYRLLKLLHQTYFKEISTNFTSYHIKTILFWAIEKNYISTWINEELEDCVALVLTNLFLALDERHLEHFFIKDMNLFKYFTDEDFEKLEEKVGFILQDIKGAFILAQKIFDEKSKDVLEKTTKRKTEPSATKEPLTTDYSTFYERWSSKYDEITQEFTTEVACMVAIEESKTDVLQHENFQNFGHAEYVQNNETSANESIPNCSLEDSKTDDILQNEYVRNNESSANEMSKYSLELKKPFFDSIKRNELTIDGMLSMFLTIKASLYQKHSFNLQSMQRPVKEIVLDNIKSVSQLTKYLLISNPDKITDVDEATDNCMGNLITGVDNGDEMANNVMQGLLPDSDELLKMLSTLFWS